MPFQIATWCAVPSLPVLRLLDDGPVVRELARSHSDIMPYSPIVAAHLRPACVEMQCLLAPLPGDSLDPNGVDSRGDKFSRCRWNIHI